ncbi:Mitoferrin [Orbilia brochopaga]|nr:Mitoferrin [Drechslerella brochopaga]
MSIPANVIYFTGYESLRYSNKSPISKLSDNVAPLVAGSLARTIAATVIAPLELFKTRLQAAAHPKGTSAAETGQISAFRQTIHGVRSMVAQDGLASLWRGLMLTLWRDVPFSGIYWWGYETVRAFLAQERYGRKHHLGPLERHRVESEILSSEEDKATFTDSFIAGATSGAVAAFVTTPFDVGKTRRQVWKAAHESTGEGSASATMTSEGSMPKVLKEIYQREGLSGLFRGCTPRMLKVAPACAIMISSYEIGKKAAMRMNSEKREREE